MKIATALLCTVLTLCFAGCGGGDGGSDDSSTFNVSPANGIQQASDIDAVMPDSLPAGTILSINPEITLDVEIPNDPSTSGSAFYENTSSTEGFPEGSHFTSITMQEDGDSLQLSFSISDQKVILTLSDFMDIGGTGYIDEYTVRAQVHDKDDKLISTTTQKGSFRGQKPRNNSVAKPVGVNRAPSNEEFYKFIVSRPIYCDFEFSTLSNQSGLATENVYLILNANKTLSGTVFKSSTTTPLWEHTYSGGKHMLKLMTKSMYDQKEWNVTVTYMLKFTTFTEGTWEIIETFAEHKDGANSESIQQTTDGFLAMGTWRIYSKTK